MLVLRVRGDTQLGADVAFLIHEGETGALVDVPVQDLAGVVFVPAAIAQILHRMRIIVDLEITGLAVVDVLVGVGEVVAVLVASFHIETAAQRLRIHETGAGVLRL